MVAAQTWTTMESMSSREPQRGRGATYTGLHVDQATSHTHTILGKVSFTPKEPRRGGLSDALTPATHTSQPTGNVLAWCLLRGNLEGSSYWSSRGESKVDVCLTEKIIVVR